MLGHNFRNLFSHGFAQIVGLGHGIFRQNAGDFHDLLLINDHPIGFFQNGFKLGDQVLDGFFPVLASHIIVNHTALHGPGTIKGHQRGDVIKRFRS